MKCWICGELADSKEHIFKASVIRTVFKRLSEDKPVYINSKELKNKKIKSSKSNVLKYPNLICRNCNNARTQNHDSAWDKLFNYLHNRSVSIKENDKINLIEVFGDDVSQLMLYVHLYFLKLFGNKIIQNKIPIDIKKFAFSILEQEPHPNVYISLCQKHIGFDVSVSDSTVFADKDTIAEKITCAKWYHCMEKFCVLILYVGASERVGLVERDLEYSWHPYDGKDFLVVAPSSKLQYVFE